MELLLVVAVLAIVAAAAAPTFFGGAKQAMDEARKSTFMAAWSQVMSQGSMTTSIEMAKGTAATSVDLTSIKAGYKKLSDAPATLTVLLDGTTLKVKEESSAGNYTDSAAAWEALK